VQTSPFIISQETTSSVVLKSILESTSLHSITSAFDLIVSEYEYNSFIVLISSRKKNLPGTDISTHGSNSIQLGCVVILAVIVVGKAVVVVGNVVVVVVGKVVVVVVVGVVVVGNVVVGNLHSGKSFLFPSRTS
jgi:hypothetical protein